jgi:8-oxo-dGTP pyrophosphatase MutT (NUDIX family)
VSGTDIKQYIRPLAICVFRRDDEIFVMECYDPTKQETFYRPLGGGIEFGEQAIATIKRELREELNTEVTNLHYLATLENIFIYDGQPGHEIVMVFDGTFIDQSIYQQELIIAVEKEADNQEIECVWKALDFFREGHAPLYPDGLLELLDSKQ